MTVDTKGLQLELRLAGKGRGGDALNAIAASLNAWERHPDVSLTLAEFMLAFNEAKDSLMAQTEEQRAARYPWTGEGY